MMINDYEGRESKGYNVPDHMYLETQGSKTSAFNKLQFRSAETRKTVPRMNQSSSVKKHTHESQNSAIRIVKRQQNKFTIEQGEQQMSPPSYISKYDSLHNELPKKVYHGTSQSVTRRAQPQSAIMQQLLASSKKQQSSSLLSSTDKLHHDLSTSAS